MLPSVRLYSDLKRRTELALFLKGFNRRFGLKSIGDEIIRRWIVAFGAILIFMGLILATASNSRRARERSVLVNKTEKGWSVAADFAGGEKISVELRPPASWAQGAFDPEEGGIASLYVLIKISNPQGGATQFMVYYRSEQLMLLFWKIIVTQQDDGLNTTLLYNEETKMYNAVGGITKYAGTYNATVAGVFPPREEAIYIAFFKKDVVTEYPYSSFLPVGAVTTAAGVSILLFGFKKAGHKTTAKKKKKRFLSNKKNNRAHYTTKPFIQTVYASLLPK